MSPLIQQSSKLSFVLKRPLNGLNLLRPMSSPAANSSNNKNAVTKPKREVKRESIMSFIASTFLQYMEAADDPKKKIRMKDMRIPHTVEAATGEEKLLLLAFENGFIDPYCNFPIERNGRGETKANPIPIESFEDQRVIACRCEPDQNHNKHMILYRNEPKRCDCGYWMELVDAPKFWLHIPKDDLLTIPFFIELEHEGKLDKFLETGIIDEEHNEHAHH